METELFLSSLLFTLVRGLRQKAACRWRRRESGGEGGSGSGEGGWEREGESARLKPDHSGSEWLSPAAWAPLQYGTAALHGACAGGAGRGRTRKALVEKVLDPR